jgi:excisionase family DNA binding protein
MATTAKKAAPTDSQSVFMRPREIATYLSVSVSTVRNLISSGKLPSVRITPDTIGVFRKDVENYVDSLSTQQGA